MTRKIFPLTTRGSAMVGKFVIFVILSGCGWLCDFLTFSLLTRVVGISPFAANFISSYVGITFVWFASLKPVFGRCGADHNRYIVLYWTYQLVSILIYSQLLNVVIHLLGQSGIELRGSGQLAIAAKVIITPFNLGTNFIFLRVLTRHMRESDIH